jgi:hypothetical protein
VEFEADPAIRQDGNLPDRIHGLRRQVRANGDRRGPDRPIE